MVKANKCNTRSFPTLQPVRLIVEALPGLGLALRFIAFIERSFKSEAKSLSQNGYAIPRSHVILLCALAEGLRRRAGGYLAAIRPGGADRVASHSRGGLQWTVHPIDCCAGLGA